MSEISATEASKRFAEMLDAVEHRGETPVRGGSGADLRRILEAHPVDDAWADELRELRRSDEASATDWWND